MANKTQPDRFTLKFNLRDPQQLAAVNILNRMGRQKAQFLAQAIIHYTECENTLNTSTPITLDESILEQAILTVLVKHPDLIHIKNITPEKQHEEIVQAPSHTELPPSTPLSITEEHGMTEESLNAINKTLKSFLGQ